MKSGTNAEPFDAEGAWGDYYAEPIPPDHLVQNITSHAAFFRGIVESQPRRILEVGCGTGIMSMFLKVVIPSAKITIIDNDDLVLERARTTAESAGVDINFVLGDAFELSRHVTRDYDVAFSQGLLEHFSDDQIAQLVRAKLSVAKKVEASVPSRWYPRQDYGNERLMTLSQWRSILSPDFPHAVVSGYLHVRNARTRLLRRPLHIKLSITRGKSQ